MKRNLTRQFLADSIVDKLNIQKRLAKKIVEQAFDTMKNTLTAGEQVKLVGFGTLVLRDKSPRKGRNPQTGESLVISRRQKVSFRPSKQLRGRLAALSLFSEKTIR